MSFVACSQSENDTTVVANCSKSNITSVNLAQGYSPLGHIPSNALAKMDKGEAEVWGKVGQKMYINYSFLDSAFYLKNKKDILNDFVRLYDDVLANSDSATYLSFVGCTREVNVVNKRRIFTRSEMNQDDNSGAYKGRALIWSRGNYEFYVVVRVIVDSTGKITAADDIKGITIPMSAKFNGILSRTLYDHSNFIKVSANGFFQINAESYSIDKSVTVYLTKE